MNCAAFEAWLDEGMPAAKRGAAEAHASVCERCAAAWKAARAIESMLVGPLPPAPHGFTPTVMARVREDLASRMTRPPFAGLPWWVRVAAEPAAALGLIAGALVAWRPETLWALALAASDEVGRQWRDIASPLASLIQGASPMVAGGDVLAVQIGLVLGLLPLALTTAWWLHGWVERICLERASRLGPSRR